MLSKASDSQIEHPKKLAPVERTQQSSSSNSLGLRPQHPKQSPSKKARDKKAKRPETIKEATQLEIFEISLKNFPFTHNEQIV